MPGSRLRSLFSQSAPPLPLFLVEGQRALAEAFTLLPASPLLSRAPRGDGHPVMVLPGFTGDDISTGVLRGYLRQRGLDAHPWLLGRNLGMPGSVSRIVERVAELYGRSDRKVSLVGWSLGGIYAREVAKQIPHQVRQVITLGSPFADAGRETNVSRLFELLSGRSRAELGHDLRERLRTAPPVPSTAILSRTDGVAHWRACREMEGPQAENIEVPSSHYGLGVNPLVLYAIADRLAQAEGAWRPFARDGWRRLLYR